MGTGIVRMKNALRDAGVAEPEFELSGFFRVKIRRKAPGEAIAPVNRQSIDNRLAIDRQAIKTKERKLAILAYIEEKSQATASELALHFGPGASRMRVILQDMGRDGTIERVGNNRYAHYVPGKK